MLGSIKYNLSHLTDLTGRDARQTFWYYAFFLVLVEIVVGFAATIPSYAGMFGEALSAVRDGDDEQAITMAMMTRMGEMMKLQALIAVITGIVTTLLFVAAFVRRLHDAGFAGWIVIIPVATKLFSLVYSYTAMDRIIGAMESAALSGEVAQIAAIQAEAAPYGAIGWIGYLVVIGFGILKSTDGPNKYGVEPVRF